MRIPRLWFTTKRISITIAIIAVGIWAFAEYQRNGTYYVAGWWRAERELWRGEATIYWELIGTPFGDACYIDQDTGLPLGWLS